MFDKEDGKMSRMLLQIGFAVWLGGTTIVAVAADAANGEAIARARCVGCHSLDRLKQLASRTPPDQRATKWEKFLPSHNLPKADERADVIAWLLEVAKP
jgi:cytochrome c2